MKTTPIVLTLMLSLAGTALAQEDGRCSRSPKDPAPAPSVRWTQDLELAKREANGADRPLLLFQLLGDLDQEFC